MKNTIDLEVPRGEAKFVLMCINLNYKNNWQPKIYLWNLRRYRTPKKDNSYSYSESV
jgi:hypothetical protein